jgi:hypothetical protein
LTAGCNRQQQVEITAKLGWDEQAILHPVTIFATLYFSRFRVEEAFVRLVTGVLSERSADCCCARVLSISLPVKKELIAVTSSGDAISRPSATLGEPSHGVSSALQLVSRSIIVLRPISSISAIHCASRVIVAGDPLTLGL